MSIELQRFLFDAAPSRRQLLNYVPQEKKRYRVQVFRNHSFELIEHTMGAYLDYAGLGVEFLYGGYDDSLSFSKLDPSADLLLLWIDTARYGIASVEDFLDERIRQLRLQFSKPVLVVPVGKGLTLRGTGVAVLDLSGLQETLGAGFLDERAEKVSGTRLSSRAMLEISRELGARYLPVLLRPALKSRSRAAMNSQSGACAETHSAAARTRLFSASSADMPALAKARNFASRRSGEYSGARNALQMSFSTRPSPGTPTAARSSSTAARSFARSSR